MNNGFDKSFKELLSNYYGGIPVKRRKKKKQYPQSVVTYAKVFDDGETLVQKDTQPQFEEYVVMQSTAGSDENFEEYVVKSAVSETAAFEEYVARSEEPESNCVTDLYAVSSSLSDTDITPAEEYRIDLTDAFSNNESQPYNQPVAAPDNAQPDENEPPVNDYEPVAPAKQMSQTENRDKEFEEDFQAILSGKKMFDPVSKKTLDKDQLGRQQSVAANAVPAQEGNGHAIFDEIAKKMQYATAYDLGVVELDKKFNDFDKMAELQRLSNAAKVKRSTALSDAVIEKATSLKPEVDTADFIKDLDAIKRGSRGEQTVAVSASMNTATAPVVPDIKSNEWPLRPANLRPLRMEEKIQEFGQFTYVDDPSQFNGDGIRVTNDWATQNIISVPIPQLNGKTFAGHVINNGSINFHKQGAERLRNLWAAWENAGLLDRILTFEGGYAARYIRRSASRSPRPLSNHAWGTAFDINAAFNGFGTQPATVGQRGCVRELVAIANQNGFFWGGHFLTKDGMHFELGHAV